MTFENDPRGTIWNILYVSILIGSLALAMVYSAVRLLKDHAKSVRQTTCGTVTQVQQHLWIYPTAVFYSTKKGTVVAIATSGAAQDLRSVTTLVGHHGCVHGEILPPSGYFQSPNDYWGGEPPKRYTVTDIQAVYPTVIVRYQSQLSPQSHLGLSDYWVLVQEDVAWWVESLKGLLS